MGTSAPVVKTQEVPIVEPYVPPKRLPGVDPSRIIPFSPFVRDPERVSEPVRRSDGKSL